jgi:carboxylesterase type B
MDKQFGTVPNPTPKQSSLTTEMQARYKAFLNNGDPNTSGVSQWPAATSDNTNAILLGSPGSAPVGACIPSFWGKAVAYDYQVYSI